MDLKRMRGIAHHLDPVVTVAESGITEGVVGEVDRALTDHELIKVRISLVDRDARRGISDELCARTGAALVQRIGKVVVLYRQSPDAKPALSNLARYT